MKADLVPFDPFVFDDLKSSHPMYYNFGAPHFEGHGSSRKGLPTANGYAQLRPISLIK